MSEARFISKKVLEIDKHKGKLYIQATPELIEELRVDGYEIKPFYIDEDNDNDLESQKSS